MGVKEGMRKKEKPEKEQRTLEGSKEQLGALLGTMRRQEAEGRRKDGESWRRRDFFHCRRLDFFATCFTLWPLPQVKLTHSAPLDNKCKENKKGPLFKGRFVI